MRIAPALLFMLLLPFAAPRGQTVLAAIRAGQWAQADVIAGGAADPLERKVVLYSRLLTPRAATAAEISLFMAMNADWPNQPALFRRLQDALVTEKDDRAVFDICRKRPPTLTASLLRCAEAGARLAEPGIVIEVEGFARRAWIVGVTDVGAEVAFLRRWAGAITPDDQWRRFDRLAWTESPAPGGPAVRHVARLPATFRPAAEARLALRRDDPTAPALFAILPEAARQDAGLVLDLARWYRRAGLDRDAASLWAATGAMAEATAPPERRAAFWDERNLLARRLLRANEPALAYAVVAAPAANPESALDQAFLAGWIALRRLDRPALAIEHFASLASHSSAAITQARAHYWLGRARAAASSAAGPDVSSEYAQAAAWPTTYYGQLAALAVGEPPGALSARIAAVRDPVWTDDRAETFLAQETARAAVLLAAWGEPRRARPFLARLDERASDPVERALSARLALGLGLPEEAVAIARRAGRDGVMLPGAGWPAAVEPPNDSIEPALTLALIRQESSFDVQAVSPVGARGLMQLMPATAASVARRLGLTADVPALTIDAAYNVRLGTSYIQGLLAQFDGDLPLAIAGYNAGPSRVQDWLIGNGAAPGDPKTGALDMIDWIEMIPFNETRNYVQRVIENIVIYRAQRGVSGPHPVERRP